MVTEKLYFTVKRVCVLFKLKQNSFALLAKEVMHGENMPCHDCCAYARILVEIFSPQYLFLLFWVVSLFSLVV